MPTPPGKRKTTLYIPDALWMRAKRRALDDGTSFNALILEGLELRLKRKKGKRP